MAIKLWMVAVLTMISSSAWAVTCRPYKASEVAGDYTLPWISGISRLVTASTCSSSNTFHSSSAVYLHNINDATFAYDFRMRYEPVCTMKGGWIIEFRDNQPDLEGTRLSGSSNFLKILTPQNRVDYYTHLRNSWWTEAGQPEFHFMDRKEKVLSLRSAGGKVKWVTMSDGRRKLVRANGGQLSFNEFAVLAGTGALDDLYVPQAHCVAYSGSSGTNAAHLHVESRCSLTDSRTCPIEFKNAVLLNSSGGFVGPGQGLLGERKSYLAQ